MIRYEHVDSAVRETDLHPEFIFHKEHELAKAFIDALPQPQTIQPCPLCGKAREEILFEKWGWKYAVCPKSWSVALVTIPGEQDLYAYFHKSDLARFRMSKEYQTKLTDLRQELWNNQLDWIEGRVRRYAGMDKYEVMDMGSRSKGWVEKLSQADFVKSLSLIGTLPPLNNSKETEPADLICLMDVVQRTADPASLLTQAAENLRPGGLLITTCRSGPGFDVLTLLGTSQSIFPLDHICLPSPMEMRELVAKIGLEVLELTTPGLLDVQLVKKATGIPHEQYFQRYLMTQDEAVLERFQGFLQQNNLSSHLRVVARKPV